MGRSQETFKKKEVRNKQEKKRKDKEKKKLARKEQEKKSGLDDMIAYVDENGMITSTPPDPKKKKDIKLEEIEIGVPARDPSDEPDPIRKGKLEYLNHSKGYGFIRDSETKDSIFVHVNNMLEEITEGNIVNFEVEKGHRGLAAVRVKLFGK